MEKTTSLPYLPHEIIVDILCRLPIKSLVRFRIVCKQWLSLLSKDPEFSVRYSCRNPHGYAYLLKCPSSSPLCHKFTLIQDDAEFKKTLNIRPPLPPNSADAMSTVVEDDVCPALTVVESISGVCCLVYKSTHVILWNPSTKDFHYAPCPKISANVINKSFFGFARLDCGDFGSSFRVVRIVRKNCRHQWRDGDPYCCTPELEAEMYDSRSDSWSDICSPPKSFLLCMSDCSTIVQGMPYWCAYTWSASIISFKPTSCKFTELEGPGLTVVKKSLRWSLGEISGSLAATMQREDMGIDVWKMVDSGDGVTEALWIKQFSIAPLDSLGKFVKCWKNGEFLLESVLDNPCGIVSRLTLYDPWTKNSRLLLEFPAENCRSPEVFIYVETLVSPCDHILGA